MSCKDSCGRIKHRRPLVWQKVLNAMYNTPNDKKGLEVRDKVTDIWSDK